MRRRTTMLLMVAIALVAVAWAATGSSAEEGRTYSDAEMYEYTCGHLGGDCRTGPAKDERPERRRSSRRAEKGCAGDRRHRAERRRKAERKRTSGRRSRRHGNG